MSKSVGIVAEYNPFHTGHRYQIDFLKEKGVRNIAVAMSASCVQRGIPAFFSKYKRVSAALKNGVDLVAEIPYPFSCKSAEGYAMAGMQTLKALSVDSVSFGSESGDIKLLDSISDYLLSVEYEERLKEYLGEKLPFAAAREKAILDKFSINSRSLSASNDILALEYIKACKKLNWYPEFIPVKRQGAAYRQKSEKDGFASASGIRQMAENYDFDKASGFIPRPSQADFQKTMDRGEYFLPDEAWEKAVIFSLKSKSRADFEKAEDCSPALAAAFENRLNISADFTALFDNLPTKSYTRARLNRIILSAFMNLEADMPRDIQYIRVLGFRKSREDFFKKAADRCPLPISHSPKILMSKSRRCEKIVLAESKAVYLQSTFCKNIGNDFNDFTAKIIKI